MSKQAYPLAWPTGWQRTGPASRQRARFRSGNASFARELSVAQAVDRLQVELDRLGGRDPVLSTNVALRLDGTPRSDQRAPADPGAAVYFQLKGKPRTLACDRWDRVADNIAAIAAHIEAIRAVDRYGVGTLEQAFAGYAQLPERAGNVEDWWKVLEVEPDATLEQVEAAYKRLAMLAHPDIPGGSSRKMIQLNDARARARELLRALDG